MVDRDLVDDFLRAYAYFRWMDDVIDVTSKSPYSVDQNVWGRSIETGHLEDIWEAPHDDVYSYTADPASGKPAEEVVISFTDGLPHSINGKALSPLGSM